MKSQSWSREDGRPKPSYNIFMSKLAPSPMALQPECLITSHLPTWHSHHHQYILISQLDNGLTALCHSNHNIPFSDLNYGGPFMARTVHHVHTIHTTSHTWTIHFIIPSTHTHIQMGWLHKWRFNGSLLCLHSWPTPSRLRAIKHSNAASKPKLGVLSWSRWNDVVGRSLNTGLE